MRELALLLGLEQLLSAGRSPGEEPTAPKQRLGRITGALLELGVELREELPDPQAFLCGAADALAELAALIDPEADPPGVAIERLGRLQQARLAAVARTEEWTAEPPEAHLARAFWNFCGVVAEITGQRRDGLLEEHAADVANYLFFTLSTSGAWGLALPAGPGEGGSVGAPDPPAGAPTPRPGNSPAAGPPERRQPMRKPKTPQPSTDRRPEAALPALSEAELGSVEGGCGRFTRVVWDPEGDTTPFCD